MGTRRSTAKKTSTSLEWNSESNIVRLHWEHRQTWLELPVGFAPPERKVTGGSGDIRGRLGQTVTLLVPLHCGQRMLSWLSFSKFK